MGSIVVGVGTTSKTTRVHITNVLHVLKLHTTLLLVSKFLSNGLKVYFHVSECIVGGANSDLVAITKCEENLYQMTFIEACGADATNFVFSRAEGDLVELWHHRLGHLGMRSVYAL